MGKQNNDLWVDTSASCHKSHCGPYSHENIKLNKTGKITHNDSKNWLHSPDKDLQLDLCDGRPTLRSGHKWLSAQSTCRTQAGWWLYTEYLLSENHDKMCTLHAILASFHDHQHLHVWGQTNSSSQSSLIVCRRLEKNVLNHF